LLLSCYNKPHVMQFNVKVKYLILYSKAFRTFHFYPAILLCSLLLKVFSVCIVDRIIVCLASAFSASRFSWFLLCSSGFVPEIKLAITQHMKIPELATILC